MNTYVAFQLTCKIVTSIFSILKNCMEVDIEKVIPKEMTQNNIRPSHDPAIPLLLGICPREISADVQNCS